MRKNYPVTLCWPLLAMLAWLAAMAWVWTKIGTVGVAWGFPLSASVSFLVAKTFSWLGRWVEGRPALSLSAFAWGASVAGLCSIWSQEALQALLDAHASAEFANWFRPLIITPLTEELSKGLFLLWMLRYRRQQISDLLQGIVYGGLIGAGFAFSEQVMYFGQMIIGYMASDPVDAPGLRLAMSFVLRGVMVPFMHPFLVAFIGLGIAVAAGSRIRTRQTAAILIGFLLAISLHGVWDWAALSGRDPFLIFKIYATVMCPLFIAMAITVLVLRHRRKKAVLTGR
ncbi:PrsW family intramembrane metalloprotease [Rhizobium rhizogenes]|uniref:PrsW family intramembrane metalloprotease n=1 Tax=Rhizobium rhizogenes TaxID=359 RepID=UPI0022C2F817|nr:PrsW family intramembrane metalloprotease [Rhizobium rhizogenes]MCZ7479977.1 PrsW family intramembrane metalloprotease [Rhizobium rhizogenes]